MHSSNRRQGVLCQQVVMTRHSAGLYQDPLCEACLFSAISAYDRKDGPPISRA
jgi:peptide methionine sulfoxide reductase MsrB